MQCTAKELKEWLNNIDDEAIISVSVYKNKHEKSFIQATKWNENGKYEENEFVVSVNE